MLTLRTMNLNNPRAAARNFILAGAALLAISAASLMPGAAHAFGRDINVSFTNDPEELLEDLIELDADGIAEIRRDLKDARRDIADAIADIDEAKEEVKEAPGGQVIAAIAFKIAGATVDKATSRALREVNDTLEEAEEILRDRRRDIGEAEYRETKGAIKMIRKELIALEEALDDLSAALREA